jgi:tight adherence protein B
VLYDQDLESEDRRHSTISSWPVIKNLEASIQQAGLGWSPSQFLMLTAAAVAVGAILGSLIQVPVLREGAMIGFALLLGGLPLLYLRVKRNQRLRSFEEQFPEALDFLARSLRAGHAFSVSLEMMAEESPEPIGTEFRHLFHEQNLGAPLETAMNNLSIRVPLLDVRFFVSAVLLQRETGGNLAEILTKLAYVIRERFRLKGHVRAASAHGRLTAIILTIMPIVTMIALMIIAPEYLKYLVDDEHGKWLIIGAIVAMMAGYWWMRRIIDIKV